MTRDGLILTLAVVAAALAAGPALWAQDGGAPGVELKEVERSLEDARSKAGELEAEFQTIEEERADLQRKLIESASRIQARERQVTSGEERLAALAIEDREIRSRLARQREVMVEMLAALQKLERDPPPVLAVRPGDAVGAIRSAMLLATVVPQIRAEADSLSRALRKLVALREEIGEQQRQLALNQSQLEREHGVIESLLSVKNELAQTTARQRDEARRRAETLAAEATSLKDLLTSLEADRRRSETAESERLAAAQAAAQAAAEAAAMTGLAPASADGEAQVAALNPSVPTAEDRRLAMARPDRLKPAVAFAEARGLLALPASGAVTRGFGAPDGYGGTSKGMSIETRPGAQVTAPNDGWVVYAGEFLGYGQLLIIDGGDGYHVLLAGMSQIDAALGQFVLAGEPVGRMGRQASPSPALGVTPEQIKPVLYVEFRSDGNSIDPQPWWAAANVKARG